RVFLLINLAATLVFRASVSAQRGAYATGVLVLFANACATTLIDQWRRRTLRSPGKHGLLGVLLGWGKGVVWLVSLGYVSLLTLGFGLATLAVMVATPSGLVISVAFILAIFGLAVFSRTLRSTELRTPSFEFKDEPSRFLWDCMRAADLPVLVPHRPGQRERDLKEQAIRQDHNLAPDLDIVFIEVHLEDPSEFYQNPLVEVVREKQR